METIVKLAAIDDAPESLELIEAALACEGLRIFTDAVFRERPQMQLMRQIRGRKFVSGPEGASSGR